MKDTPLFFSSFVLLLPPSSSFFSMAKCWRKESEAFAHAATHAKLEKKQRGKSGKAACLSSCGIINLKGCLLRSISHGIDFAASAKQSKGKNAKGKIFLRPPETEIKPVTKSFLFTELSTVVVGLLPPPLPPPHSFHFYCLPRSKEICSVCRERRRTCTTS